ncbi:DUF7144 family membrane protein [Nocardioides mangrovi]|uniref:DUF7144 domain-containing protein n=1 Tax=Nocardioides mangrovi TaxID=2874580 RepID=A0ABS7U8E1_9ACTN|nr:hypothetical protein [Nocardioides mangrovi]MBZ5737102.1 hypothetical protein [Nocardioides mangrovi]
MFGRGYDEGGEGRRLIIDATSLFAGVLILLASLFSLLQGAAAIANDELYSEGSDYLYRFDMDVWGTVQLVIGALGLLVAYGVIRRSSWGLVCGMILACLSMVTNFAQLPTYPFWSMTLIAFDVLFLWALSRVPARE